MTRWKRCKIRGAPEWLYESIGVTGSSWWVRDRRAGRRFEKRIEGLSEKATWIDARRAGDFLINESRGPGARRKESASLVRTEELCNDLIHLARAKAPATYEQREIFMRLHLIPWLNENCPIAGELDSTVWDRYKNDKRLENAGVALFNHWKFFVMLFKFAFEQGLLKKRYKLEFDEKREDFRERGKVIPDTHLALMLKHANQLWQDRIRIQRLTGMRPGEVRNLRVDRVDMAARIINLHAEDTKTRHARPVSICDEVCAILRRRASDAKGGEFFFPAKVGVNRAMDRGLAGWERAIKAANKELTAEKKDAMPAYTPHDLRHTYLTEMFKGDWGPARICFHAGLAIEEAQRTYLHFTAEDTRGLAEAVRLPSTCVTNLGSEVMQTEVM